MQTTFRNVYRRLKDNFPQTHRELTAAFPVIVGARTLANQVVNNSAAEVNSALSVELEAGKAYAISVFAPATITVTQGMKIDFAGSGLTATSFVARAWFWTDNAAPQYESITALNTSVSSIVAGTGFSVEGTLVVATAGTLTLRFAQQAAGAFDTILLAGSRIIATEL